MPKHHAKKIERRTGLIDPVYQKFNDSLKMNMGDDEFYKYFMTNLMGGTRKIQFSNRRLEKKIDKDWVVAVENCIEPFRNIIMNPRNFIVEEEEIVNIAVASQSTPDILRHLTTHGKYIDKIDEEGVKPNHLLKKFKEDSWNTYENRFAMTLLEKTTEFVNKRFNGIFENLEGEFGAFLKVEADSKNDTDTLSAKFDVRIRQNEDYLADDEESMSIFDRIRRINEDLKIFNGSLFATTMRKYARVKNPIVKTNAIQKNPNFKACYKLWVFLYAYKEIGYEINIYEQSTEITPEFALDANNVVFNQYLILKNYLEENSDRLIDTTKPYTKRVLKPRFIKKIIEELVKNYDISDTEIRKVLIEEFTKAQLEQLEEKERRALVEQRERERAEKRRREAEIKKKEQERKQRERARRLKAKEAEQAKKKKAEEKRQQQIIKLVENIDKEIVRFEKYLDKSIADRNKFYETQDALRTIQDDPKMFLSLDSISGQHKLFEESEEMSPRDEIIDYLINQEHFNEVSSEDVSEEYEEEEDNSDPTKETEEARIERIRQNIEDANEARGDIGVDKLIDEKMSADKSKSSSKGSSQAASGKSDSSSEAEDSKSSGNKSAGGKTGSNSRTCGSGNKNVSTKNVDSDDSNISGNGGSAKGKGIVYTVDSLNQIISGTAIREENNNISDTDDKKQDSVNTLVSDVFGEHKSVASTDKIVYSVPEYNLDSDEYTEFTDEVEEDDDIKLTKPESGITDNDKDEPSKSEMDKSDDYKDEPSKSEMAKSDDHKDEPSKSEMDKSDDHKDEPSESDTNKVVSHRGDTSKSADIGEGGSKSDSEHNASGNNKSRSRLTDTIRKVFGNL